MRAGQHSRKRPVRVNGVWCESMSAGARCAGKVLGRDVRLWEIQRILNGKKRISGLRVESVVPKRAAKKKNLKTRSGPPWESLLDMGIPEAWR